MKLVITIIVIAAGAFALAAAQAQSMHHHDEGPKAAAEGYAPGLGEIMSFQQMRHSKLWSAGRPGNWGLAAYEIDELKEGFEDVAKYAPSVNGVALPPIADAIAKNQLPDLAKTVEAKDRAQFRASFDRLTAACNSCHQVTKHEFIVIQRPTGSPYTNQTFTPAAHHD